MDKDLVITMLTNKLGEVAQRLFQLGHEYKLAQRPFDAKVMNGLAGGIWATLTQCEVSCGDIQYEGEKSNPGFLS